MLVQPKSLTLIRHGKSLGNLLQEENHKGRIVNEELELKLPDHKIPLDNTGKLQALETGKFVKRNNLKFTKHFVSQYERAKHTARNIFGSLDYFEERSDLNEMQGGYLTLFASDYEKFEHETDSLNLKGQSHHRPIGGENHMDLDVRVRSFLMWVSMYHADDDVVLVGHGLWIKSANAILEGRGNNLSLDWIENCEMLRFERSECGKKLICKSRIVPWKDKF